MAPEELKALEREEVVEKAKKVADKVDRHIAAVSQKMKERVAAKAEVDNAYKTTKKHHKPTVMVRKTKCKPELTWSPKYLRRREFKDHVAQYKKLVNITEARP